MGFTRPFNRVKCFLELFTVHLLIPARFRCLNNSSHFKCFTRFSALSIACFPALFIVCMLSRAFHHLHIFPRFSLLTCFPALFTLDVFSRPSHCLRFHIFPRLLSLAIFSSPFHRLHVLQRFSPFACFPALLIAYMFFSALFSDNMFLVRVVIGFHLNYCFCHYFGFELYTFTAQC